VVIPQQYKLLVVHDDVDVCAAMKSHLERRHFSAFSCSNPDEVLSIARTHNPHLLLIGQKMATISQPGLLTRIRASCARIKIIIMGQDELDERGHADLSRQDVADYIQEPITIPELDYTIERVLNNN
jgi:DNA-binding NtrC family response regulator